MNKLRRIFVMFMYTGIILARQPLDVEASGSPLNNPGIASKLAQCVGQFDAAQGYGSYVDGFSKSRLAATKALNQLIASLKGADASIFIDKVQEARLAYQPELVKDPMNTLGNLRTLMRMCAFYTQQAENVSADQTHQEALAEAARDTEQKARLQADSDKRQHEFEQQRIALETEKAKAEATRIQAARAAQAEKDNAAKQTQTIGRLEKENAELLSKVASLEKEKSRLLAEAETSNRIPKATQDDRAKSGSDKVASAAVANRGDASMREKVLAERAINTRSPQLTPVNLLEAAITPGYGTQALWDNFLDEGGLVSGNTFFKLPVTAVTPSYDKQGKIESFEIILSKIVSAKEVRGAIDRFCGSRPEDWQTRNSGSFLTGFIEKPGCNVSYMPYNDTNWDISFSRDVHSS